jgi:hypothetical protein
MAEITNSFVAAIMNKDMDERIVPSNSYRDALNIDIDVSEGSDAGSAQNKLGNTKIGNLEAITGFNPVTAMARTIGSTTNEKDNVIYWLIASDKFDGIYEFSEETGAIVRVLQSNKLTPSTPSKLNFSKSYIVTGFNFVDGFLYWSDGYNPPRKINISRAKSYSVDDARIDDDIDVILEPPLNSPTVKLSNDIDKPNNIEEKFVYFAYRYKYIDNQLSSLSPFSAVAFNPKDFELDFAAGNNKSMVNKFNTATVTFKTGNRNVKEIQLIMRDTRNINASLVETFNKQDLNIDDNSFYSFAFNNNKTYTTITPDQISRLFDNVPLSAKAQEFVGNRIMYGNYTQFQNIDEPIDINLNYTSVGNTSLDAPIQTFKSDRDYEMAIVYLDKYGRMTTPLTSENNTIYIPATKSNKGNSLQLEIKNNPPSWATNYRLYIKQSKGQYYNIFPLYMYVSGEYRYFLINESDRDKIPVGDYLIFKSVSNGPTFSNKKYKVLELKPQLANFEGIQGAQAGLYFKVKADSNSDLSQSGILLWYEDSYGKDIPGRIYGQAVPVGGNALNIINNGYAYIENPIYYGDNNGTNILSVVNNNSAAQNDNRITIKADSATTFIWTNSINGSTGWSSPIAITLNTPIQVGTYFQVNFSAYPVFNDIWKINIRGVQNSVITNYFGGIGLFGEYPYLILAPNVNSDLKIKPGDIITISIHQEPTNTFTYTKEFYANSNYDNIEEWFVESGSYLLFDSNIGTDSNNISFRRGIYDNYFVGIDRLIQPNNIVNLLKRPVFMVIRMQDAPGSDFNRASGYISIKRSENIIIAETSPKETDIDIYHELSKTFNIYEGNHLTRWSYKDFTFNSLGTNLGQLVPGSAPTAGEFPHGFEIDDKVFVSSGNITGFYTVLDVIDQYNIVINLPFPGVGPAIPGSVSYNSFDVDQTVSNSAKIQINNTEIDNSDFNAWSYNNALETYRIRDDFNKPTLEYSLRAMATVDEYKKKFSKNSICYSGTYGENTNINRLNEFNLSNANFKYLDSEYGSIQKLHARDTNLVVFQEDKVSEVLYGKNLLSDSVGGGSIVSIQEVLGSQVAYPGEWGISLNPESFSKFGTDIYFSDSKRGIVLQMSGDQVSRISDNFMTDYFRDLMMSSQYTQKLGAYDPHNNLYTLSSNDISVSACRLELNRLSRVINYNTNGNLIDLFTITTDGAWDIELVDIGWGTNWVSGFTPNGFGSQDIDANISTNISLALRKVVFNVKYCTDKNIAFILTQSGYNKITVVTGVFNTVNQ